MPFVIAALGVRQPDGIRVWRELVWRNAERLLNAKTDAERATIAQQIQRNAALWAQSIAAVQVPGSGRLATRTAPSGSAS